MDKICWVLTHFQSLKLKITLNFISLYKITSNEIDAAIFLQQKGILHREKFCDCGSAMRPTTTTSHNKQILVWLAKRACDKQKGVRPNTWLDPSKLPTDSVVHYLLVGSRTDHGFLWARARHEPLYYSRFKLHEGDSAHHLLQKQHDGRKIGGPGLTVEID